MGIINVLEENVYNLIAAGEVVERPASVIKELMENSIDAHAKNITVEIKNGGISYMRVTDDGCGIEPDDVGVAFLRHATSKIKNAEDLSKIGTLGFRGEALCSIAAVSDISLISKTENAKLATKVMLSGGCMEDVLNVGAPQGTTIEVRKLFFNTPARMKFLKKDATEAGYVADIVEKFILSNPDISIKFINSGKQVLFSPGSGSGVDAIYSVYGKDYAKNVIKVNYQGENMSVDGYIGKSSISRPNRAYQSFFVNKRQIKSAIMTKALEEAYKNQIMIGKFPFAVLNLNVNFETVDVNVHPHKTEVKFSDEKQVFETVYWAVKNALYEKSTYEEVKNNSNANKKNAFAFEELKEKKNYVNEKIDFGENEKKENVAVSKNFETASKENPQDILNQTQSYIDNVLKPAKEIRNEIEKSTKENLNVTFSSDILRTTECKPYIPDKDCVMVKIDDIEKGKGQEDKETEKEETICDEVKEKIETVCEECNSECSEEPSLDEYKICGSVFDTYIILTHGDEMILMDQHAAHERLKYEKIKADIEKNGTVSQNLICARPISLSATEYEYAISHIQEFKNLGFEYEDIGYKKVILNAVPSELCDTDYAGAFVEIIGEAMDNKMQLITKDYERALYTVACKAAVKANHALGDAEAKELLKQVLNMKNINTCPHGRPIMISYSKKEIEKQFKRIV